MKKILSILCVAIILTSSFTALAKYPVTLKLSAIKKDDRDVKNFTGVGAGGPINVVVTIGSTESCRLEGDADAIATLITEVKSNILVIRPENSWTSWSRKYENKKITVYVTAKSIKSLTMSGSGSIVVNSPVNSNDLSTVLSGSGNIKTTANVKNFTAVVTGSGNITISGNADDANITLSGSGAFAGKDFSVNTLSSQITGSGSVNIKADKKIKAFISGSGAVNYSGNAAVDKTVIGSGGVRKI